MDWRDNWERMFLVRVLHTGNGQKIIKSPFILFSRFLAFGCKVSQAKINLFLLMRNFRLFLHNLGLLRSSPASPFSSLSPPFGPYSQSTEHPLNKPPFMGEGTCSDAVTIPLASIFLAASPFNLVKCFLNAFPLFPLFQI